MHIQVLVVGYFFSVNLVGAQAIFFDRIFVGKTISTCQLIHTAVRTRIHYIVLNMDSFTVFSADESHGVVTVLEFDRIVCQTISLTQFRTGCSLGVHSYQSLHAVATVNVQQLAGRAKTVSGINVSTVFVIVIQTPVIPIVGPEFFEVVDISTFYVQHFAEQSLLSHVQCSQFEEVIYTVFQLHTVLASLFRSID